MKLDAKHVVIAVIAALFWSLWLAADVLKFLPAPIVATYIDPNWKWAGAIVMTLCGWLGVSSPQMPPVMTMIRAVFRKAPGGAAILIFCVVPGAGLIVACDGCSGAQVPPQVVQAGADFAACVIARATVDAISGTPANKVVADCIDTCGCPGTSDPAACAAAVNQILDAMAKSQTQLKAAGK